MTTSVYWRPYQEYKEWVARLGFRHYQSLLKYTSTHVLPVGFPASPRYTYKDEYEGDIEFFSSRPPLTMPFEDARRIVRRLNLSSAKEYYAYVRRFEKHKPHTRLPVRPTRVWSKDVWTNWGDYLGTGRIANINRVFLPYKNALAFVHQLNLKGEVEWKEYAKSSKRPPSIPHNPWEVYDEYVGMKAWVGTDVVQKMTTQNQGLSVLCILHDPLDAPNVHSYKIFKGGKTQAELFCRNKFVIVRTYEYESDYMDQARQIIQQYSTEVYDQQFTATNFNELCFQLDTTLKLLRH